MEPRDRQIGWRITITHGSLPEGGGLGDCDGRRFHSGSQSENSQRSRRRQREVAGGKSDLTSQRPEVLPSEGAAELDIIAGTPGGRGGQHQHTQDDKGGQRWQELLDDHPHRASSMPAEQTRRPYHNAFKSQLAAEKLANGVLKLALSADLGEGLGGDH